MDVDGTLTDGKIYMGASGEMMKQFDVKDGLGIKLLMHHLLEEEVAYIGDDLNDVSAIRLSGITFAPADCASQLKPYIDIILTKKAGDSPVREAIDRILEGRIHLEGFLDL